MGKELEGPEPGDGHLFGAAVGEYKIQFFRRITIIIFGNGDIDRILAFGHFWLREQSLRAQDVHTAAGIVLRSAGYCRV